ncbi:Hydantoin utilization protein B [Sulfitobacter noctilucicola]|uniref:N-methylhydantoinase B n=1 Tax=Sulfitobacter noctilucicola TaxID=1342301 RepID=A0A7W6Q724_9RHOB|nr:hydantoinase B/oxoprolinase family protein [Sulfitobacter noctilucicola]KIN64081.1 Hydantoin utilization protein B [Sulfitobacter noctilucicola]MBB4175435.1 N-methylhydantoinase B [Sulfitobacter noctilucicola]
MVAQIIEANPTPFSRVDVDPITLDIVENALRNARNEMDAVLFRTAMSPGIREQHDAFPLIANQEGKMVVGQFGSFLYGFMEGYEGTVEDGDIFITNDPYSCDGAVSHLNDWLLMMPIFHEGKLVSWAAMFGHMTDVGGKVPGSLPTDAKMIYEEGIIIPPTKIYRGGELQNELLNILLHNTRMPEWNKSDFFAIIAGLRLAERRVRENIERFGTDIYISAMWDMLDRNKAAMGAIIQMIIPEAVDGKKAYFEDWIDDDGMGNGPYKIACHLHREGEIAYFDFTGSDPQSFSSINFLLNEEMFKMFFGAFTINLFDPQILFNDGFYDLVDVHIPEGCILKPQKPAALSCRTHMLGRIFDLMGGLLGQGAPDALNAAGFSDSPHFMYSGFDKDGDWYQLFQIGFGGVPGRPAGDGPDGHSMWPAFTNVPNEFLEAYFPLRIREYATIPDSGGAGVHRGGNGITIAYEMLETGEVSIHDDRWLTYPWGVNGGEPGLRSTKRLVRADGTEENIPSKCDRIAVEPGDILYFNTWGGGGWGNPLERDPELVLRDMKRGLVTVEGAKRYGVVLKSGGVDQAATAKLRKTMEGQRGEPELFSRGFSSIEELKARCLKETGFEPPMTPKFRGQYARAAE